MCIYIYIYLFHFVSLSLSLCPLSVSNLCLFFITRESPEAMPFWAEGVVPQGVINLITFCQDNVHVAIVVRISCKLPGVHERCLLPAMTAIE